MAALKRREASVFQICGNAFQAPIVKAILFGHNQVQQRARNLWIRKDTLRGRTTRRRRAGGQDRREGFNQTRVIGVDRQRRGERLAGEKSIFA
ncbi:MAG: hypothetical protein HYX59_00305 [Elusimicrobia bacterium]|nr:hypothetical protein [Elusimicrobiota bacterium]